MDVVDTAAEIPIFALTTDEPFHEPTTIGEHLPNGRQRYFEWARTRKEEIKKYHGIHVSENHGSNNSDDSSDKDCADRMESLIDNLRTPETFPSKWLVDSDDDEEERSSSTTDFANHSKDASSRRGRNRKSALFQKSSLNHSNSSGQPPWWKHEEEIVKSIPSKASGIVGVMGRRIHMDRLIDDDASLYSMLRAWVRDDPGDKPFRRVPGAAATDTAATVQRKTLLEYSSTQVHSNGSGSKSSNTTNHDKHSPQRREAGPESEASPTTSTLTSTLPSTQPPFVDILGWLDIEPELRASIPCYPDQEEMIQLRDQRRAKKEARAARKRRLASARETLRRKGIRI